MLIKTAHREIPLKGEERARSKPRPMSKPTDIPPEAQALFKKYLTDAPAPAENSSPKTATTDMGVVPVKRAG